MKAIDVDLENNNSSDITNLVNNAPHVTTTVTAHHKHGVVHICSTDKNGKLTHLTIMSLETAKDFAEAILSELSKRTKRKTSGAKIRTLNIN